MRVLLQFRSRLSFYLFFRCYCACLPNGLVLAVFMN